jgi:hypothetical protein
MNTTQYLSERQWDSYYEPIENPTDGGGSVLWELTDARRYLDELGMTTEDDRYIWTVLVDDDSGTMWVASGVWKVNALAYVVTKTPWEGSLLVPWGGV